MFAHKVAQLKNVQIDVGCAYRRRDG